MPDDARERLRRAQHPGHRRQAHPADPQRDEHRRRGRGERPGHRRARRAVQHRRRAARYLVERARRRPATVVGRLRHFGLSSICNVLAAIKTAKLLGLGPDDAVITDRHRRRRASTTASGPRRSPRASAATSPTVDAAAHRSASTWPRSTTDHVLECTEQDRNRIFNLGYYTWVEQQGTPLEVFEARRSQRVLAGPAGPARGVGRADRRLQRPDGPGLSPPWSPAGAARSARRSCPIATPWPWRCPSATAEDPPPRPAPGPDRSAPMRPTDDPNPLVAFDSLSAVGRLRGGPRHGHRRAGGARARRSTTAVAAVDGTGFRITPVRAGRDAERRAGVQP